MVFANTHYGTGDERMRRAVLGIEDELRARLTELQDAGKLLEAQRLRMRTEYDLEMLAETGVCSGVENYSRHLDGRAPGEAPFTLLDFFPKDFLVRAGREPRRRPAAPGPVRRRPFPQGDAGRPRVPAPLGHGQPTAALRGVHRADRPDHPAVGHARARGSSSTAPTSSSRSSVRPGWSTPRSTSCPPPGRSTTSVPRIDATVADGYRVLVTTLTKKMAEDLTDYLAEQGVRVQYLHSDVDTMARIELLRELRLGVFDVLVGINLLREGLDLPEVALVAILDADKEGFLRSASSLIQTMGRAARNVNGRVVMYADRVTDSMTAAIGETQRRRARQIAYNEAHGIDPSSDHQVGHRHPGAGAGRRLRRRGSLAGLAPVRGSTAPEGDPGRSGPRSTRGPWPPRWPTPSAPTPTSCPAHPPARRRDGEGGRGAALRGGGPHPRRGRRAAGPAGPGPGGRQPRPAGRDGRRRRPRHRLDRPRPGEKPVLAPVSSSPWLIDWWCAARASTTCRTSPSTSPATG